MPEPILSAVLQEASEKAGAIIRKEIQLQLTVKKDIESLEEKLKRIQDYLKDAEKKQHSEEAVKHWLKEIEDFAYDAEDVLDEVATEALRQKVEGSQDWLRQVSDFFLSCFTCSIMKPLLFRRGIAIRVKEIREGLDQTIQSGRDLGLQKIVLAQPAINGSDTDSMETSSYSDSSRVVGRHKEIGQLLGLLLPPGGDKDAVPADQCSPPPAPSLKPSPSDDASSPQSGSDAAAPALEPEASSLKFSAISISGMSGLGKTTLVRMVYGLEGVVKFFTQRIWACESQNFQVKKLIYDILVSWAPRSKPDPSWPLDVLQKELEEAVKDKRFLIVLDDVWIEEKQLWNALREPLNSCGIGSKVIITTREVGNATTDVPTERIPLQPLSQEHCWSIFKSSALHRGFIPNYGQLEKIGKDIVGRAHGVPLVAKALGGLVKNYGTDPDLWSYVLNADILQLEKDNVGIIPVLRLSYDQLPAPQKLCFAYCSVFPKGYVFRKFWLIHIWIAQGFVRAAGAKRLEDVGSDYFDALLSRSFFQKSGEGEQFVMHDLMHDLAHSVSEGECHRVISRDDLLSIPEKVRHLSLSKVNQQVLEHLHGFPRLRSLIFINPDAPTSVRDLHNLLKKLRNLRVLILDHIIKSSCSGTDGFWSRLFPCHLCGICSYELPPSIGFLIHLRYLLIHGCSRLPESVSNLYNLQFLTLKGSKELSTLPSGFTKLVNLRWLETEADDRIDQIAGVGNLDPLRKSNRFHVGGEPGHMIGQLKHLNVLRGELFISGLENVSSEEEASDANLEKKYYLDTLQLEWGSRSADLINPNRDEKILKCLKPNANLKNLVIMGYGGDRYPQWLWSFQFLKTLRLVGCQKQKILPPLGELPSLRELAMTKMHEGQTSGCFRLDRDRNYIETLFPELKTLRIQSSLSIGVFPTLPSTLIRLDIDTPTITVKVIPSRWIEREGRSLPVYELQLSDCTDQKVQWIWKELMPHHLRAVKKLCISKCKQIVSLPRDAFEALEALTTLSVIECPMLSQLPSLPTKLRELKLSKLDLSALKEIVGCWSLAYLDISNCPKLTELPPLPPTLEYLGLDCVGLLALPEFRSSSTSSSSSSGPSLHRLDVSECHGLTSLCQGMLEQELRALEEVFICCCDRLVSLPGFEAFSSLRLLTLFRCPNLSLLPWASAPVSLETFEMDDCPLLMEQYEASFSWPKNSPPQIAWIDGRWRRVTWSLESGEEASISYIPTQVPLADVSKDQTSLLKNIEEETSTSYVSTQMPLSVIRVIRPPKKKKRGKPYLRGRRFEVLFPKAK